MDKNTGNYKKYELRPLDTLERKEIRSGIRSRSEYNGSKISDNRRRKSIDSPCSKKCIYT